MNILNKETIENILRQHDPQGLIKMGAPQDEYSHEAEMIANNLSGCKSKKDFQTLIHSVFVCQFGGPNGAGSFGSYAKISNDIYNKHLSIKEEHIQKDITDNKS